MSASCLSSLYYISRKRVTHSIYISIFRYILEGRTFANIILPVVGSPSFFRITKQIYISPPSSKKHVLSFPHLSLSHKINNPPLPTHPVSSNHNATNNIETNINKNITSTNEITKIKKRWRDKNKMIYNDINLKGVERNIEIQENKK